MIHDEVCECSGICDDPETSCSPPGISSGCGCSCEGIALGRAAERNECLRLAIRAAGTTPTLGQRRMLRALRGDA